MHGLQGCNIPCDLHVEHLNHLCKEAICGLGANQTPNAITCVGKCIGKLSDFLDHYDNITLISTASGRHTVTPSRNDHDLILVELTSKACFKRIAKCTHASFANLDSSVLSKVKYPDLKQWIEEHMPIR